MSILPKRLLKKKKKINLIENKKIQPRVEKCSDPKKLDLG